MAIIESNKKFSYAVQTIILILFVIICFLSGINHEPWADEAQSWLIARDCSFFELFSIGHYEGTPILWYCLIKLFQLFGLKYSFIWIIPLTVSTVGVFILEYFVDTPLFVKVLLPFSFYIAYQSATIARSYSLVFPLVMLLCVINKNMLNRKYLNLFVLILLACTSSFGFVLSASIFLLMIYSFVKDENGKINLLSLLNNSDALVFCAISALLYILVFVSFIPAKDCMFSPPFGLNDYKIIYFFSNLFFADYNDVVAIIVTFVSLSFFVFCIKSIPNIAAIVVIPIILYSMFGYLNHWHYVNIFMAFLYAYICFPQESKNRRKYVSIIVCIALSCSSLFAFNTINYDIKENFCGSKNAATFVNEILESDKSTLVFYEEYMGTAIQPYFDSNVFNNTNNDSDVSYYNWSRNHLLKEYSGEHICVISNFLEPTLEAAKDFNADDGFEVYYFCGGMFWKNKVIEDRDYAILIKKDFAAEHRDVLDKYKENLVSI